MSVSSVRTRPDSSGHRRNTRVYGRTTTAMHDVSVYPLPLPPGRRIREERNIDSDSSTRKCAVLFVLIKKRTQELCRVLFVGKTNRRRRATHFPRSYWLCPCFATCAIVGNANGRRSIKRSVALPCTYSSATSSRQRKTKLNRLFIQSVMTPGTWYIVYYVHILVYLWQRRRTF